MCYAFAIYRGPTVLTSGFPFLSSESILGLCSWPNATQAGCSPRRPTVGELNSQPLTPQKRGAVKLEAWKGDRLTAKVPRLDDKVFGN